MKYYLVEYRGYEGNSISEFTDKTSLLKEVSELDCLFDVIEGEKLKVSHKEKKGGFFIKGSGKVFFNEKEGHNQGHPER